VYSQDDFYSFAAHFAAWPQRAGDLAPILRRRGSDLQRADRGAVKHPGTGKVMSPRPLFLLPRAGVNDDETDPRQLLAAWLTSEHNPFFAKVLVTASGPT